MFQSCCRDDHVKIDDDEHKKKMFQSCCREDHVKIDDDEEVQSLNTPEVEAALQELAQCRIQFKREKACSDKLLWCMERDLKNLRAECEQRVEILTKKLNSARDDCDKKVTILGTDLQNVKGDCERQVAALKDKCSKFEADCLQLKEFIDQYAKQHHHLLPSFHFPHFEKKKSSTK